MPRLPRIQVKGAVYYVTCQSIENQEIFKDKEDYKMYLEMVSKYKSQYKFRLYSYCLLPNRLELLIEPSDEASISEVMHDIHSLYTKYYNGKYDKKGHLFESRFRSVLVEKVHYLLEMTRHIHLAPKRFGLSGGLDHPHSSYQIYCLSAESNQPGFSMADEKSEILQFLKNKNDKLTYEKYVLEGDEK